MSRGGYYYQRKKHIIINKSDFELRVIYKHTKDMIDNLKNIPLQELEVKIEIKEISGTNNIMCEFFKRKGDKFQFYSLGYMV